MRKFGSYIIILIIFIIVILIFIKNNENWTAFYYPNKNDLTKYIKSEKLKSIQECRDWIAKKASILDVEGKGFDYECGKSCSFDKKLSVYICKETLK